jgi:hypothetical protein
MQVNGSLSSSVHLLSKSKIRAKPAGASNLVVARGGLAASEGRAPCQRIDLL